MTETDPHSTIAASTPRLGEIGRAVARNIRGLAEQVGAPSFASSLASATQARASAATPPAISAIRPEGRTFGPPAGAPAGTPAGTEPSSASQAAPTVSQTAAPVQGLAATGPAGSSSPVASSPVAGSAATPMLVASARSTAGTRGTGTTTDPVVIPYGSVPAGAAASAAEVRPLDLKQYPKPAKSDRSGVLSWAPATPPAGRDLDRFIAEARSRRVGWATFEVDPAAVPEYDELIERLTEAGIQPIVRIQDPYGDLPPAEIKGMVKDLRGQGARYFQLFDGANVASETPDDRVDVREYAGRWLAAAQAVVAGGGLPGIGALSPDGDYDDLGFMRQLLSVVKERGGTEVLGQAWMALRGETPGTTATAADTEGLGDRAGWYDRLSRHALGRSLPILTTLDPSGRTERLPADPVSSTPTPFAEQSERAIRDLRRKLPGLFGASRGTVESSRP